MTVLHGFGKRVAAVGAAVGLAAVAALAGPAAPAAAETTAVALNRWVSGTLPSSSDVDDFTFRLVDRGYVSVVLGDLPVDARLQLFDSDGTRIATSDHRGTRFERIDRNLAAGPYRVRVSTNGGTSRAKYSLIVRAKFRPLSVLTAHRGTTGDVVGELVSNTFSWTAVGQARAAFYDADGRLLRRTSLLFPHGWYVVPPRGRVPFQLPITDGSIPARTAKIVVEPEVSAMTDRTSLRLTTTVTERTRRVKKGIVFVDTTAKVVNRSTRPARVAVVVMAQDRRGVVVAVSHHEELRIAAGATRTFEAQLPGFSPTRMRDLTLVTRAVEATNQVPS